MISNVQYPCHRNIEKSKSMPFHMNHNCLLSTMVMIPHAIMLPTAISSVWYDTGCMACVAIGTP